jgi:predicted RNase H-like nuclease
MPGRRDLVESVRVLGVDACRAGWVGIVLEAGDAAEPPRAFVAGDIAGLVALAEAGGPVAVVGIDIPIGLPDRGRRQADILARAAIGPRRSSVFMTPVRPALLAADHATAVARSRALAGEGVSIQAYGLRAKLLEVERWIRGQPGRRVAEVHPEVCFARLAGAPLEVPKNT